MQIRYFRQAQLTLHIAKLRFICLLISATILTACIEGNQTNGKNCCGEIALISNKLEDLESIIFFGSFETIKLKSPTWKQAWGIPYTTREEKIELSRNAQHGKHAIRIHYPKGNFGAPNSGAQFPIQFSQIDSLPATFDSLYLSYHIYFEDDFDFRLGGKLPGLMGGGASWERSGGWLPSGRNGWSARFMWREDGRAVVYAYLPPGKYRTNENWGSDIDLGKKFTTGKWHQVEQYVKVNSIGKEDGQLHVWLDGEKVLEINDMLYRTVQNGYGEIGGILVSTFHGGNDARWAPRQDSYILLDSILASKKRIPITLLNETDHRDSL